MMRRTRLAAGAGLALGLVAGAARGAGDDDGAAIRAPGLLLDLAQQPAGGEKGGAAIPEKAAPPRFGEARSRWWSAGVGVANNLQGANDFNIRGAYSYFLVDDVEFSAELNGWYFQQPGRDAVGINPAMVVRWHFIDDGTWTVYGDVGIGLLFASDEVPEGGTQFDFTPRIGGGVTRLLDPATGLRLQAGLRWHHISNARIYGAADNPSRDGLMVYAGLQWPF